MKKLIILAVMTAFTGAINAQNIFANASSACVEKEIATAQVNQSGLTTQANIVTQQRANDREDYRAQTERMYAEEFIRTGKANRFWTGFNSVASTALGLAQVYFQGRLVNSQVNLNNGQADYLRSMGYSVEMQTAEMLRNGRFNRKYPNAVVQQTNPYLVPGNTNGQIVDRTQQYQYANNTQNYSGNQQAQYAKDQYGRIYILQNGQWMPYQQNANNTNLTGGNNGIGTLSGNNTISDRTTQYSNGNTNLVNQGLGAQYQYNYGTNGTGSQSTFVMPGGNQVINNNNGMVWNAASGSYVAANGGF